MLSRLSRLRRNFGKSLFDLFVSSISGNDANTGTQMYPVKTLLTAINKAISENKFRIGLKAGEIWDDCIINSVFTKSGISIKPYDKGFATFDNRMTLTNFTLTDGYTNIYESSFPAIDQGSAGISAIVACYKINNNTLAEYPYSSILQLTKVSTLILCDNTINSFYTTSENNSISKIYINIGENPNTSIYTIKIPYGIKTIWYPDNGSEINLENIIVYPAIQSSPTILGSGIAKNLFFPTNSSWHYYISCGGKHKNIVMCNSNEREDIAYVNYQGATGGINLEYSNSLFIDISKGMYAHNNGAVINGTQNINNIFIWGKTNNLYAFSRNNMGEFVSYYKQIYINNILYPFYGNGIVSAEDIIAINVKTVINHSAGIVGKPNIFKNIISKYTDYYISTASGNYEAEISNSILHQISSLATTVQAHAVSTLLKFYSHHNIIIIDAPNNSGTVRIYPHAGYGTDEAAYSTDRPCDYNIYIICSGLSSNIRWGRYNISSFDTWKTNSGKDTHSIYIDLTGKGGFSYLFNEDYTMKDVPEKAQILAVGAGLTKTFRGFPVKPTYEEAHQMQIDGTLDYYTRDLFY